MSEMTVEKIKQTRGPKLEFEGRLIANTDFNAAGGTMFIELWETRAGNWVAVSSHEPNDDRRPVDTRATVIEKSDDEMARRIAALDHWNWVHQARDMTRKQLQWDMTVVVP